MVTVPWELGTIAGASVGTELLGLVYIDLDTDLNTPDSVEDGALDWMGVAHLLGLEGTVPALAGLGPRTPMLRPDQVLLFANDNSTAFERRIIEERGIPEVRLASVAADPAGVARGIAEDWADATSASWSTSTWTSWITSISRSPRRRAENVGLRFPQLVAALRELVAAPNWVALTICEVNPDHGEPEGATICTFSDWLGRRPLTGPPTPRGNSCNVHGTQNVVSMS